MIVDIEGSWTKNQRKVKASSLGIISQNNISITITLLPQLLSSFPLHFPYSGWTLGFDWNGCHLHILYVSARED